MANTDLVTFSNFLSFMCLIQVVATFVHKWQCIHDN